MMVRIHVRMGLISCVTAALCLIFLASREGGIPVIDHISETALELTDHIHYPGSIPKLYNPFTRPSHKPPVQANSTNGQSSWFSDWKWKHPFSSTITLDENRAVLPPLRPRAPVYTFYDDSTEKSQETRTVEQDILLMWRRAWWAQGFKPVVLGRPEAMNNPLYQATHPQSLSARLEADLTRWLAWSGMGGGIFTDWLVFPMAPFDDHFLSFLRKGQYPHLTRFEGMRNALLVGDQKSIESAILQISSHNSTSTATSLIEVLSKDTLLVGDEINSIAFYDRKDLSNKYKAVADELIDSEATGLALLAQLINAHLQTTWQSSFPKGIAILEPLHQYMAELYVPAIELARKLAQCPATPIASSCPPNDLHCRPCQPNEPMKLSAKDAYYDEPRIFSIGTVPHPFITTVLQYRRPDISIRYVRRNTTRDLWLTSVMKDHLVDKEIKNGQATIVTLKEAIAGDQGWSRSLWLTAEQESVKDLNWLFGFALPPGELSRQNGAGSAMSDIQAESAMPESPLPDIEWSRPTNKELEEERELLKSARSITNSDQPVKIKIRDVVEAWNLLDTEAWHFARAYSARRRTERLVWEEEEKKFAGAEMQKNGFMRWLDSV